MKHIVFGDITAASTGIILHGCNAQSVMGSGLAYQVKKKWPVVFTDYCHMLKTGKPPINHLGCVAFTAVSAELVVASGITQCSYGTNGKYVSYKAIQKCFNETIEFAKSTGLEIHYPLIGAGLGGGEWSIISNIIDACFDPYPGIKHTLWITE